MRTSLLIAFVLCSCVTDNYVAVNGNKSLTHSRKQFGGTASFNRGDGSGESNDMQTSARDFFSAVGTVAGAVSYGYVQHANNAANALTTQQLNASAAKTAQAKVAADAAATAGAQKAIITVPPQTVTFPK